MFLSVFLRPSGINSTMSALFSILEHHMQLLRLQRSSAMCPGNRFLWKLGTINIFMSLEREMSSNTKCVTAVTLTLVIVFILSVLNLY